MSALPPHRNDVGPSGVNRLDAIEEKGGGERIGGAARRSVEIEHPPLQFYEFGASSVRADAAGGKNIPGARLGGGKGQTAAAMEEAGIVKAGHHGEQRFDPRFIFGQSLAASRPKNGQPDLHRMGKTVRGFAAAPGTP